MIRPRRLALAVVVALGAGACGEAKDASPSGGPETTLPTSSTISDQPPGATTKDHWHAAFGVQICGELLAPVSDAGPDRTGLHSHNDGLLHIHPFSRAAAGVNANLAAFFDSIGYEVSDDVLVTPKGTLKSSVGCDGKPAEIRLLVDGTKWTADINAFRPQDGQVLQLLFDTAEAPAVDLPWADEVRSPNDVRALGSDHGGRGSTV